MPLPIMKAMSVQKWYPTKSARNDARNTITMAMALPNDKSLAIKQVKYIDKHCNPETI